MRKLPSLIGVIHLPPLAGTPIAGYQNISQALTPAEALQQAGLRAVKEAKVLAGAGFDALILENFGDTPFYKDHVPPETVASMAVIAAAVRETVRLPIGINILRNDARSALAVAAVTGCQFIRVNVLCGVAATDQGLVDGDAANLLRERTRLQSEIAIFADAHVKHARSLSSNDIALAVEENALRAQADAVIVTGATTGRPVNPEDLQQASHLARKHGIALYVGSGTDAENIAKIRPLVHGVIVGSALRKGGQAGAALDTPRLRKFVRAFRNKK